MGERQKNQSTREQMAGFFEDLPDSALEVWKSILLGPTYKDRAQSYSKVLGEFAQAGLFRFWEKACEGWTGWDGDIDIADMKRRIIKNVHQGDWVDVLNLAAMCWWKERKNSD